MIAQFTPSDRDLTRPHNKRFYWRDSYTFITGNAGKAPASKMSQLGVPGNCSVALNLSSCLNPFFIIPLFFSKCSSFPSVDNETPGLLLVLDNVMSKPPLHGCSLPRPFYTKLK